MSNSVVNTDFLYLYYNQMHSDKNCEQKCSTHTFCDHIRCRWRLRNSHNVHSFSICVCTADMQTKIVGSILYFQWLLYLWIQSEGGRTIIRKEMKNNRPNLIVGSAKNSKSSALLFHSIYGYKKQWIYDSHSILFIIRNLIAGGAWWRDYHKHSLTLFLAIWFPPVFWAW